MDRFYIFDTTLKPNPDYVIFNNVSGLVNYLDGFTQRVMGKTRDEFMYEMTEIGHGYDDSDGVNFTRLLSEYVNIGIIQDGKPNKCDVHAVEKFSKPEYGN